MLDAQQLASLQGELTTDPLARGYAGMTNQQVADDLNTVYRSRNRASMTGDEIFATTVPTEFDALPNGAANNSTDAKNHWLAFCGRETIDPFAAANVEFVKTLFGAGSATVVALNAARIEPVSRAEELGLGTLGEGDIWDARNG